MDSSYTNYHVKDRSLVEVANRVTAKVTPIVNDIFAPQLFIDAPPDMFSFTHSANVTSNAKTRKSPRGYKILHAFAPSIRYNIEVGESQ